MGWRFLQSHLPNSKNIVVVVECRFRTAAKTKAYCFETSSWFMINMLLKCKTKGIFFILSSQSSVPLCFPMSSFVSSVSLSPIFPPFLFSVLFSPLCSTLPLPLSTCARLPLSFSPLVYPYPHRTCSILVASATQYFAMRKTTNSATLSYSYRFRIYEFNKIDCYTLYLFSDSN